MEDRGFQYANVGIRVALTLFLGWGSSLVTASERSVSFFGQLPELSLVIRDYVSNPGQMQLSRELSIIGSLNDLHKDYLSFF